LEALTARRSRADVREAGEVEGIRLAIATRRSAIGSISAELDQAGFLRMRRECKLCQALLQIGEEALGITAILEAYDGVVRLANEDDAAGCVTLPPLVSPQVIDVVKADVRKQRRDHRSPRGAFIAFDPHAPFEHAHLQPFLDQADEPLVADAMFPNFLRACGAGEANQPVVADRIEELRDVGVEDPVDVACLDPDRESVQRIVLAASSCRRHACGMGRNPPARVASHLAGASCAEAQELRLVHRREDGNHRRLDDLVLDGRDAEWSELAVRFRDEHPSRWQGPVRSAVNARVQISEVSFKVCRVVHPRHLVDADGRTLLQVEEG
jgi:hypothetical protein